MAHVSTRELPPLDDASMDAWFGFLRTHAAVVRELDVEMQAAHDLSLTQYEVLLLLARSDSGSLRLSDLAHGALLSLSGLSRLVDRLAAMGLVERAQCPDDRRSSLACLTPAGRKRFREARPTHLEGVRRLFIDRLPDGTVDELNRAWTALGDDPA
ncbi:MAG: MarR family transcriptional regulator [Thermoleophilia bacterium]|nr:MarR family transcriptional regulator [Thermoleophilia bacterium]